MFDALQKRLQQVQIEDRLGHDVLRARLHLPFEAADLLIHVQAPGFAPTPISSAVCEPIGLPPISRP